LVPGRHPGGRASGGGSGEERRGQTAIEEGAQERMGLGRRERSELRRKW
jgi:hypothetical protein